MYESLGLLPTPGENLKKIAALEMCLLRKMVTCSILILPAVHGQDTPFRDLEADFGVTPD